MQELKQRVEELNKLVASYKYTEAFDRFYDEGLIKHENEDPPLTGLPAQRKAMEHFLSCISENKATVKSVLLSDDISVTEWACSFKHKDWGQRDFNEVTVQRWKDGKVIHERHHYKTDKF